MTKFSKDMDFEPLSRVLEHYISNSWVLFWRWNPLAFCVLLLTTIYFSKIFWPSSEKWTLPYFVFPFYNPHYSQGRSAVRRTYILAIPRGLKLKGPPGSSSFIKRSTIVCDKSVLMGLLIGIQQYIVVVFWAVEYFSK